MKLLVKEGKTPIIIAYNVSPTDELVLESLRAKESLVVIEVNLSTSAEVPMTYVEEGGDFLGRTTCVLKACEYNEGVLILFKKAQALLWVRNQINAKRTSLSKNLVGQDQVYADKAAQAAAFLADPTAKAVDYKYVDLDAKRLSITAKAAATAIVSAATNSNSAVADTEDVRLRYNKTILNAKTSDALAKAYSDMMAELAAI